MLIQLSNVLSKSQVQEAQAMLEASNWVDGKSTAGHQAKLAKDNLQLSQKDETAKTLGDFILARLSQHPMFTAAALPNKIFPPMFNCYQGGNQFGDHVDNAIRYSPSNNNAIRTDISITVFISEPNSYDGGELVIQDTFGQQQLKLAAGDAILYPSSSLHHVTAVTKGRRLASFFWLQSLIRNDDQRRILFELDQSIQTLSQQQPQEPELIRLSGVYHNLIRQWSDT